MLHFSCTSSLGRIHSFWLPQLCASNYVCFALLANWFMLFVFRQLAPRKQKRKPGRVECNHCWCRSFSLGSLLKWSTQLPSGANTSATLKNGVESCSSAWRTKTSSKRFKDFILFILVGFQYSMFNLVLFVHWKQTLNVWAKTESCF